MAQWLHVEGKHSSPVRTGGQGGAGGGDGEGGGTLFPATHAHLAHAPANVPARPAMADEQHELGPDPQHPVYSIPEHDGEEP